MLHKGVSLLPSTKKPLDFIGTICIKQAGFSSHSPFGGFVALNKLSCDFFPVDMNTKDEKQQLSKTPTRSTRQQVHVELNRKNLSGGSRLMNWFPED